MRSIKWFYIFDHTSQDREKYFDKLLVWYLDDAALIAIESLEIPSDIVENDTYPNEVVESDFVSGSRGKPWVDYIVKPVRQSVAKVCEGSLQFVETDSSRSKTGASASTLKSNSN